MDGGWWRAIFETAALRCVSKIVLDMLEPQTGRHHLQSALHLRLSHGGQRCATYQTHVTSGSQNISVPGDPAFVPTPN